ncbi:MAG: hypothetical protein AAAB14_09915, partial [Ensifer adhaerens]
MASVDKPGNVIASRRVYAASSFFAAKQHAVEVTRLVGISEEVEFCEHGTPRHQSANRQVAGNSNGNYVERRAPFVEANSVGNTSASSPLRLGLSSRARPNSSSAFDRKSRLTGSLAGGGTDKSAIGKESLPNTP